LNRVFVEDTGFECGRRRHADVTRDQFVLSVTLVDPPKDKGNIAAQ
jgi:hypothetical protein